MDIANSILKNFSGSSPLFPLPNFVLFPMTGYSFRIFESRYIEMVEHVMADEKLICVTQLNPEDKQANTQLPAIHSIGTLAYIISQKTLENSEFIILTFGLKKVQINEAEQTHSYRRGALTIIEDNNSVVQEEEKRIRLFRKFSALVDQADDDLEMSTFQNPPLSIEMLVNMMCQSLPIPCEEQQKLLELPDVALRLDILAQFLDSELKAENNIEQFNQIVPFDPEWN